MAGFPTDAFMIVSADYIKSYARVHCGNQQSSWHGTTVQIVQPQPRGLTTHVAEVAEIPHSDMTETDSGGAIHERLQPLMRSYSTCSPSKTTNYCSPRPKKLRHRKTGYRGPGICVRRTESLPR